MTIMWKQNGDAGFFNPFNLCRCVLKPPFFCSSVEQTLKSCSAFTVALTGLNKSAARFDSERVSKIIPDSRLCWKRAAALLDTDIKGKSAFVTLLATSFPPLLRGYFTTETQHIVFLPRNNVACFLCPSLKTKLNLWKERLKHMNRVSSQRFPQLLFTGLEICN